MIGKTLLDTYEVYALVARGGFGDIFLGRDRSSNTVVAIKTLHADLVADPIIVRRFRQEAQLARSLTDPHLVRVLGEGEDQGTPFLVMDYVQGLTLEQLIETRGPLPVAEAVGYTTQILQALAEAHRNGIIHRDIKPCNAMVLDGQVKVMDFGIARLEQSGNLTSANTVMGTPRYMAPEQIRGETVDARADLYSVALTLYELLAGQPAYASNTTAQVLYQQLNVPPPSIVEIRADVSPTLFQALQRGLEKDPARRFQSAEEMRQALEEVLLAEDPVGQIAPPGRFARAEGELSEPRRGRLDVDAADEDPGSTTIGGLAGPNGPDLEGLAGRGTSSGRGFRRGILLWGVAGAAVLVLAIAAAATLTRGPSTAAHIGATATIAQTTAPLATATPAVVPTPTLLATATSAPATDTPKPTGPVFTFWGSRGTGPGQFRSPFGVAVDAQGNLYVADTENDRIQKLSPTGQPVAQWGNHGKGPGQFDYPTDIALDAQGNLYVTDNGNYRVQKLSPTGQPLAQWGSEGTGPGQFGTLWGIVVDAQGSLYVAESSTNRIQKLSATGQPIAQWGSKGTDPGQFNLPTGVTLDAAGNVYVADSGNHRIQKLSPAGQPLAQWGTFGTRDGDFNDPERVAIDAQGNLYVVDPPDYRFGKLSPDSQLLGLWGSGGTPLDLLYPHGIAIDRQGNVFVADTEDNRIIKMTLAPSASE